MNDKTIIVGVKGPGASRALAFAMEEAALRRSPLHVITAVHDLNYGLASLTGFVPPKFDHLVDEIQKALQKEVDEVAARREATGTVPITVDVQPGHAGKVLCDASQGAAMLVLGHHSHDMIASLGSVTLHCVLHATCPVMVVR
jgi:nucleotide-binding universal stress UspA family protein